MTTKALPVVLAFNRGAISRLGLARVDIKRTALSAETMVNYMSRVLGPMRFRPGTKYLASVYQDAKAKMLPFVFSTDDTAVIELTDESLRVWVDDAVVSRAAVTTAVSNGNFTTDLTGWTNNDEAGATSAWATGGYMELLGDGTNSAIRDQQVTVAGGNIGVEQALRIVIERGPVTLRVGSASAGDQYVSQTDLATGEHSLAFTPTGDFYIRFTSALDRIVLVDSCNIEAAGDMVLPTPWTEDDLYLVRWDQSGDILFVACKGRQQRRIERREVTSWSVVKYYADDGPFRTENLTSTTLTAAATTGNTTLTASKPVFKSTQVGGLYKLTSIGQLVSDSISAQNVFTEPIRVIGVGDARRYSFELSGTWTATVTLQRSVGVEGVWEDQQTFTANTVESNNDQLDNQLVYYRLGVKTGDYGSGTVVITMTFALGGLTGVARITGFTSETVVDVEVLSPMGGIDPTEAWSEGSWSDRRGWPTAVAFYEGRLWWAGKNGIQGSISDAFDGFDPDFEGDAGPINRTIGSGPVDDINFLLPLQRLILGAEGAEFSARSTTFDEPLTPSNFNIKTASTQGSFNTNAVKIDSRGVFVSRCGSRVYELDFAQNGLDYTSNDLTALNPEVCEPSVVAIAVQRQPDTRVHAVLSDGTVAIAVVDRVENVLAWQKFETDGLVEDAVTLPGFVEDQVYYVVNRSTTLVPELGVVDSLTPMFETQTTANQQLKTLGSFSAGSGYTVGDILTVDGGTYTRQARVRIYLTIGGAAFAFVVIDAGDYTVIPPGVTLTLSGGTGTGASTSSHYWGTGSQAAIAEGSGFGYEASPALTFSGGGGSGVSVTSSVQLVYTIFYEFGSGYSLGDVLTLVGGSYVRPATIKVEAAGGGFASIFSIVDPGEYTIAPAAAWATPISLSGGTGSGARITGAFGLGTCTIVSGGTGFTTPPTVVVPAPTVPSYPSASKLQAVMEATISSVDSILTPEVETHRYLEKWALESECVGGALNKQADAFVIYDGAPTTTFMGLDHLEGRDVVVWGDGQDLSPDDDEGVQQVYRVLDGAISLVAGTDPVANAVIGLPYTAQWKSSKLAFATTEGTALAQRKNISQIGLILAFTQHKGIKFGPDFDTLDPLPEMEEGVRVSSDTVYDQYDGDMIEFPGEWNTDSRVCLQSQAPRACTVMALVMAIEGNVKS